MPADGHIRSDFRIPEVPRTEPGQLHRLRRICPIRPARPAWILRSPAIVTNRPPFLTNSQRILRFPRSGGSGSSDSLAFPDLAAQPPMDHRKFSSGMARARSGGPKASPEIHFPSAPRYFLTHLTGFCCPKPKFSGKNRAITAGPEITGFGTPKMRREREKKNDHAWPSLFPFHFPFPQEQ